MKICSRKDCPLGGVPQDESCFRKDPSCKSGLRSECKTCSSRRPRRTYAPLATDVNVPHYTFNRLPEVAYAYSDGVGVSCPSAPRAVYSLEGAVVAIGDLHFPFHHLRCVQWMLALIADAQPAAVVQMGDLYDQYSHSKYPRSHNVCTPLEEARLARANGEWFWGEVQRVAPNAKCFQLGDDNHGWRAVKRARELYPEAEHMVESAIKAASTFENVTLVWGEREDLEINGVVYEHGSFTFGKHAGANGKPTVIGHLHRGEVVYTQDGAPWEMCVGWGGDKDHVVFDYAGKRRRHRTTLGLGWVDAYGPRFIPYPGK